MHLFIHFSGTNDPKIDGNSLSDLSKNESVQDLRQDKLDNDEQMHSKVEEGSSSSKTSIQKINSTSHAIHKVKKNKKTLMIL